MTAFRGAHVLITGAASGLGRLMALDAARKKARLTLMDRDAKGLGAVCDEIHTLGGDAEGFVVDLSSRTPYRILDDNVSWRANTTPASAPTAPDAVSNPTSEDVQKEIGQDPEARETVQDVEVPLHPPPPSAEPAPDPEAVRIPLDSRHAFLRSQYFRSTGFQALMVTGL